MPSRRAVPRRNKTAGVRADIEKWLSDHGVEWEYWPEFPIEEIDVEKSLHNQARMFEPLDPTVVAQYAEAFKRGDPFPGVVVAKTNQRQRGVLVDGNHRLNGMVAAGGNDIDAYVITKARPAVIVQLTFESNVRHGKPTSHEERVNQAVWLVDNGAKREQAAASLNIKVADINRAWQRIAADRRADEVGLNRRDWEAVAAGHRVRLTQVATDEGFRAAANLAFRAVLTQEELVELIRDINSTKSAAKQVAVVKQWEITFSDRIQAAGGGTVRGPHGRGRRTPKQALGMALGSISALPENLNVFADLYLGDERVETAKRAREASDRLANLASKLEAAAKVG